MDHINRGSLKLDGLRGLVLDEADEMLQMGFAEDVEWVLSRAPKERQVALFSATMPEPIRRLAQRHLRNPAEITITQKSATPDALRQRFVAVEPHQKRDVLARILKSEPIDAVLVFVNTKGATEPLADYLSAQGHRAAALSGDVPQTGRERIVEALCAAKLDVIVATDVAARGLDVQRISHVINFDLPLDTESYIHRIGRTGRASRTGNAILFVHPRGRHTLKRIEHATARSIERMEIPTIEDINRQAITRFHQRITAGLVRSDLSDFSNVVESYHREHGVPIERIAALLAALAHGDSPLLLSDELPEPTFDENQDLDPRRSNSYPGISGERRRAGRDGAGARRTNDTRGSEPTEKYRIEVGHMHQVKPTNIVGAIANETGLHSRFIGRIEIFDEHSTVDLLTGMPPAMFQTLKNVKISGRRLDISRVDYAPDTEERPGPAVNEVAAAVEPPTHEAIDARPVSERPFHKNHPVRASSEIGNATRKFGRKPKSGEVRSFGKKTKMRVKAKLRQRTSR